MNTRRTLPGMFKILLWSKVYLIERRWK